MLLELAIGDAYGAGFEYAPPGYVRAKNDGRHYARHPRHRRRPGTYTDDTQMSLAVAETIVSGDPWTPERLADGFVAAFRRDPRRGYAGRFYSFLQTVTTGATFLAAIQPDSDKSGAAMRAGAVGVFPTVAEVIARATVQAAITHNTAAGIGAAVAAALMTHYFLYDHGPKRDLGRFLEAHVPGAWATPWRRPVGAPGWMSVRAAVTAVTASSSLADLLRRCIAFTGDVDTVATIALAAGACSPEIAPDLPNPLLAGLENGPYGRDYIRALDARLLARVVRPPA